MTSPTDAGKGPVVDVRGLNYAYASRKQALVDVTLQINAAETVGLIGPSGAGKSTLLWHLNGLLPDPLPSDGSVIINGQPLTPETAANIRREVGLLFQDPSSQLFCPTVTDDVAFGPLNLGLSDDEVSARVKAALDQVNMSAAAQLSPQQLSIGEQKRVCLAGVLACQPQVLALDEPSANLDPRARRRLLEILRRFDGCQIVASHDLDFILQLCDRVLVIDRGRIEADGPAREILGNASLMERHGLEVPLRVKERES